MAVAQFSGLASGIDSAALIDAIIEARETTNLIRKSNIDHLESENDSLEELNTKILALNDLVDQFRSINGGGVKKKATSSDSTALTATAGSNAGNGSFGIGVTSLANTATYSFDESYASVDAVVHATNSGNIDIQVGTGDDRVDISVAVTANDTTITQLVDAINSESDASGRLSASMLNVGTEASPDYRVVFNTLQAGDDKGYIDVTTAVLAGNSLSQASNAEFTLSGISGSISRDSNTVDDVIQGVTLQLLQEGSTSTVTVGDDSDATSDLLSDIVEAYNDIVEYVNENDSIERVEISDDDATNLYGSLAKTNTDNDFLSQFRSGLFEADSANGTAVQSVSQIGISTNRDGTLSFDVDDFKEAIANDSLGVQEVITDFADISAGITGFMYDFTKLNGIIDISQKANDSEIDSMNDKIDQLDRALAKTRSSLEKQFTALEVTTSKLQSEQSQLSGILAGL